MSSKKFPSPNNVVQPALDAAEHFNNIFGTLEPPAHTPRGFELVHGTFLPHSLRGDLNQWLGWDSEGSLTEEVVETLAREQHARNATLDDPNRSFGMRILATKSALSVMATAFSRESGDPSYFYERIDTVSDTNTTVLRRLSEGAFILGADGYDIQQRVGKPRQIPIDYDRDNGTYAHLLFGAISQTRIKK